MVRLKMSVIPLSLAFERQVVSELEKCVWYERNMGMYGHPIALGKKNRMNELRRGELDRIAILLPARTMRLNRPGVLRFPRAWW